MTTTRVPCASWLVVRAWLVLLAGTMVACSESRPLSTAESPPFERYPSTDESIAFTNLDFTIDSARLAYEAELNGHVAAGMLVSSLLTRARFKNSFADLDEADEVAKRYVEAAPESAEAWLVKAEVDVALHRFTEGQAAIERASALGAPPDTIAMRRATILVATGRAAESLPEVEARAKATANYNTLTQLAGVHQAMGENVQSEAAFAEALKAYGDVSPFAVAWVQFERAMLLIESDPHTAVTLFDEALHYLPSYVSARTDRAAALAANGDVDTAIAALKELCATVDDPEPAGLLAGLLIENGDNDEAQPWRDRASQGFEALLQRHRLAFADHAAEFYLRVGEPSQALALAEANFSNRDTPRSRLLVELAKAALAAQRD